MKTILLIAFLAFGMNASAQIILEQEYDSAATYNWCAGAASQLMIINFEVSGERYVRINRCGETMDIYDLNHTQLNSISLAGLPHNLNNQVGPILYLSEKLFDTDSQMEFMYIYDFSDAFGNGLCATNIYNENLSLLFSDTSAAWVILNIHQQQYPIYNTAQGTKMILSCPNDAGARGKARVFSLPGTYTLAIEHGNELLMENYALSNPHPNPTNNTTQIDFTLPDGLTEGEIVFYDLYGSEIRRFKVYQSVGYLVVSTSDIAAGTYYYHLQTSTENSGAKKMVVIK